MTKEEAIENIKLIRFNAALTNANSFRETLDMAIEALSQPSLPSNLDEAAEKFNREDAARMWDYEGKTEGEIVKAAFKACAEWMTEQGVSMQITDNTEWADVDSFIHKNVGGGSIIQIRKK